MVAGEVSKVIFMSNPVDVDIVLWLSWGCDSSSDKRLLVLKDFYGSLGLYLYCVIMFLSISCSLVPTSVTTDVVKTCPDHF